VTASMMRARRQHQPAARSMATRCIERYGGMTCHPMTVDTFSDAISRSGDEARLAADLVGKISERDQGRRYPAGRAGRNSPHPCRARHRRRGNGLRMPATADRRPSPPYDLVERHPIGGSAMSGSQQAAAANPRPVRDSIRPDAAPAAERSRARPC
jgi:hypothetical protein